MIRVVREADAAEIAAIYAPFVADSAVSFELVPPSPDEMARRIRDYSDFAPWLVCELNDSVAGYAYASRHRDRAAYQWSVEVSAYVRADVRRQGVARTLYDTLLKTLARQGFFNAYAGITLPNEPSIAFHTSLGFKPVGVYRQIGFKLGRWHDVSWMACNLQPHVAPDAAPRPFSAELLRADSDPLR